MNDEEDGKGYQRFQENKKREEQIVKNREQQNRWADRYLWFVLGMFVLLMISKIFD